VWPSCRGAGGAGEPKYLGLAGIKIRGGGVSQLRPRRLLPTAVRARIRSDPFRSAAPPLPAAAAPALVAHTRCRRRNFKNWLCVVLAAPAPGDGDGPGGRKARTGRVRAGGTCARLRRIEGAD
jgi:hypothetical protein